MSYLIKKINKIHRSRTLLIYLVLYLESEVRRIQHLLGWIESSPTASYLLRSIVYDSCWQFHDDHPCIREKVVFRPYSLSLPLTHGTRYSPCKCLLSAVVLFFIQSSRVSLLVPWPVLFTRVTAPATGHFYCLLYNL